MAEFLPVAVSMGDPAGIGPEIIVKAWARLNQTSRMSHTGPAFFCLGDPSVLQLAAKLCDLPAPVVIEAPTECRTAAAYGVPVLPTSVALYSTVQKSVPDPANSPSVKASIEDAVRLCLEGHASALVTAPISKAVMYEAGFDFPGHTEYLASLTEKHPTIGPRGPLMMLAGAGLRVVLTSIHQSLSTAVAAINTARIIETARIAHYALKSDFGISKPRLALAGLNPHAGENGAMGHEEIEIINPAARQLRSEGIDITDALPPDTMFHTEARAEYDAAICHYHDQGLIPVKTLDFHGGVNITLGLPIIRTSPDHGTAFDIAGKNLARPESLIAAIQQAQNMVEHRNGR